jgi:hypothetical protein
VVRLRELNPWKIPDAECLCARNQQQTAKLDWAAIPRFRQRAAAPMEKRMRRLKDVPQVAERLFLQRSTMRQHR